MTPQKIASALMKGSPVPEDVLDVYLESVVEILTELHASLENPKTEEPFLSGKFMWTMDGLIAFGIFVGTQPDMEQHPVYWNASEALHGYLGKDCETVNGLRTEEDAEKLRIVDEHLVQALSFAEELGVEEHQLLCQVGVRSTVINCWPGACVISQPVELRR